MAGWIKIEKDLEDDPRVLRMAKALSRRWVFFDSSDPHHGDQFDPSNAIALPAVTLVCGALQRLWRYADSHAREDDTLDLGEFELDEIIGIPEFCSLMPVDWLVIISEDSVKLPNFHAHNGIEAKRRALTQKRVAQHRYNAKRDSVTPALPDQDQDQDQEKTKTTTAAERPTTKGGPPEFEDFKSAYPARLGSQPWPRALKAAHARLREGHTWAEMIAGAKRYSAHLAATGKLNTEFVKQAATFLGPDKAFLEPFETGPKRYTLAEATRPDGTLDPTKVQWQ